MMAKKRKNKMYALEREIIALWGNNQFSACWTQKVGATKHKNTKYLCPSLKDILIYSESRMKY